MPTNPTKVNFLLCEDVREEKNGKFSLIGAMAGDGIILPKGEDPGKAFPSLAILAVIKDGEGDFKFEISLLSPGGKDIYQNDKKHADVKLFKDSSATLIMVMKPFNVPEFGKYKLTVSDNTHSLTFEYEFYITTRDKVSAGVDQMLKFRGE